MKKATGKLTVFFEEPFWVGVFEQISDGKLAACKITFGAEPKDYEVYDFILKNYNQLRFSPAIEAEVKERKRNPKRKHREVQKQLENIGIGTKSQQALKIQQEQMKIERYTFKKEQKKAQQLEQFALKQQKKKEKHRGR